MSIMVGVAVNFRLSGIPRIRCLTLLWRFLGMQFIIHIFLLNLRLAAGSGIVARLSVRGCYVVISETTTGIRRWDLKSSKTNLIS
ncbi:hypothetical protein F5051DRAFT_408748 [Lentinula edodes]|nr:hypothetical protein F5051DRAFT_408748 [Lentinula edodes]